MRKFFSLEKDAHGKVTAVGTIETVDRDGDIVRAKGLDTSNYESNPVIMFAHNWNDMPIGKAVNVRKSGDKILFDIEFAQTDEAQKVKYLIENGYLNSTSIGFIPKKVIWNGDFDKISEMDSKWYDEKKSLLKNARKVIWESELLELSIVPIPANPNAQIVMHGKGINTCAFKAPKMTEDDGEELLIEIPATEVKKVVPFKDTPVKKDMKWSKSEALKKVKEWATNGDTVNMAKYKQAFTWYDAENADNLTAYKLPHHTVENGELVAVWRGVTSAMAALLGARGGVDIPEGDRKGVYNHLAKHYKANDVEPPKFKEYTLEEAVKELDSETLEDMLQYFDIGDIKQLVEKVNELETNLANVKSELETLQKSIAPSDETDADKSNDDEGGIVYEVEGISMDELKTILSNVTTFKFKKGGENG